MTEQVTQPSAALERWEKGHQLFFVLIQDLVLVHKRLSRALMEQDWPAVSDALCDAEELWWSCATAFHHTGDFTREVFNNTVRPSMEPPNEQEGFSGMWSADHMALIVALGKLRPSLESLPSNLKRRHRRYLWALTAMYQSHAWVCVFHAGTGPSIKDLAAEKKTPAPDSITHLMTRTLKSAGCPKSLDSNRPGDKHVQDQD